MTITADDVKKIARLSKIRLEGADATTYANALSNILDMAAQLQAVDTTNVPPYSHPLDAKQRLREDKVTEHNERDTLLKLAPQHAAGLYLVPQVIE